MTDSMRQSLLISEESEGLLDVPLKSTGTVYLPYLPAHNRFVLQQSVESVCALFGGAVKEAELVTVLKVLETPKYYGPPAKWLSMMMSLIVTVLLLLLKLLLFFFWCLVLMDPLVLIAGFWLVKRMAVLLCVVRVDYLALHYHKPLRKYMRDINSQWTRYGLVWTMESRGAWLSLGPAKS